MLGQAGGIRLFEALELKAEYEARIETIRECLPGAQRRGAGTCIVDRADGRDWGTSVFDPARLRTALQELDGRRDALDEAIRRANASYGVTFRGRRLTLGQAFELRGAISREISALQAQVIGVASRRARPTGEGACEPGPETCPACVRQLDEARRTFRALNRLLWMAAYDVAVAYGDAV